MTGPLNGRRILVTRAAHQAGKLSEGLRAAGAEAVEVPVLEIQPPVSFDALDAALRNLDDYDWLILTSANAVHALVERAAACGIVFEGKSPQVGRRRKSDCRCRGSGGIQRGSYAQGLCCRESG